MKIVGQLMAKNEGRRLLFSVRHLLDFCDEVICLDNGSTDGSIRDVQEAFHGRLTVIKNTEDFHEKKFRTLLAQSALDMGATHGVALDPDEALVRSAAPRFHQTIERLQPGDYLLQTWIPLWKSYYAYRTDPPHFPNLRSFIWAYDGADIQFSGRDRLHTSRIPVLKGSAVPTTIEEGILHFAQANWLSHSIKTCWYMVMERRYGLPLERLGEYLSYFDGSESLQTAPARWLYHDLHQPDWDALPIWRLGELLELELSSPELFENVPFPIDWRELAKKLF